MRYLNREEINEHCTILMAIITDLIRDVKNIVEYVTYIQKGSVHSKLMPTDDIIERGDAEIAARIVFPFQSSRRELISHQETYRDNCVLRQNKYLYHTTFFVNCIANL